MGDAGRKGPRSRASPPERHAIAISGLGAGGDGVGRLADGRVVFVAGALPGDEVAITLTARRKRVQYAKLEEVIKPSPHRVTSRCRVADCGGCPLSTLSAGGQAEVKLARVVETLRRIGRLEAEPLVSRIRQFGDGWGYRHRVRLHAEWSKGGWRTGYFRPRSRQVEPFVGCPVLVPPLSEVAMGLAAALAVLPKSTRLLQIEIAYSRRDQRAAARLRCDGELSPLRRACDQLMAAGLSGIEVLSPNERFCFGNLELRLDHARADVFDICYEPGVFTQAHPAANDALVEAVVNGVRPRERPRVLELHAGIGNFSLPLVHAGAHLVAVEKNRRATILCQRNARRAGRTLTAVAASDVDVLTDRERYAPAVTTEPFDVILLDPPRSGAAQAVSLMPSLAPRRIVYVSCDPATLARDGASLRDFGFELCHLDVFDMFPQTPHVEVLALFARSHRGSMGKE